MHTRFYKKALLSICVYAAVSASAFAANEESDSGDNKFVIGGYFGTGMVRTQSEYYVKSNGAYRELPFDDEKFLSTLHYGGKIGYDMSFTQQHGLRLYGDYIYTQRLAQDNSIGNMNMHTFLLNAEYRFTIMGGLSVFAGGGLGLNTLNTQRIGNIYSLVGSVNGGIAYAFLGFLELELKIRYLGLQIDDRYSSYLPIIQGEQTALNKVEFESPIHVMLGLNFRF